MEDLWIVIIVIKDPIPFPIAVTPRITGPPWGHSVVNAVAGTCEGLLGHRAPVPKKWWVGYGNCHRIHIGSIRYPQNWYFGVLKELVFFDSGMLSFRSALVVQEPLQFYNKSISVVSTPHSSNFYNLPIQNSLGPMWSTSLVKPKLHKGAPIYP